MARLHYRGGGDWYNDPSIIPNLQRFIREHTTLQTADDEVRVTLEDDKLFQCPILFMTGHGRIRFSQEEAQRLRTYLENGGFLYADDDYGMDKYFREEIKKVFPDKELVELPVSHPIYHIVFDFPKGLPKIHEHDGKPAQGFGIFDKGRLVVYYTYQTNISDGWADPEVHGDPENLRQAALKMGTNIVIYALTH
ncbi:MAG: DUF4159 domain-containing protein [Calditrichaeota bacterium]|nr:DUF4159 domain-containing protein [Calditrichota bacterium]